MYKDILTIDENYRHVLLGLNIQKSCTNDNSLEWRTETSVKADLTIA